MMNFVFFSKKQGDRIWAEVYFVFFSMSLCVLDHPRGLCLFFSHSALNLNCVIASSLNEIVLLRFFYLFLILFIHFT